MPAPSTRTRRRTPSPWSWIRERARPVPRHRQAQDLGRARHPAARRRLDVGQRPHAGGVLPPFRLADDRRVAIQGGRTRGSVRPPRARPGRWAHRTGRSGASRDRPRTCRGEPGAAHPAQARGLPHARRAAGRAQEGRSAQGAQGAAVLEALARGSLLSRAVARQYFGTDGVRGVVGETLTAELVEQLGKAAALWCGRGRIFVGRDTRASGPELEEAFARGVASAGGAAVLGGVLPTPAVALLGLDLGVVISASHNPPEYNGVKFFDSRGRKLTDAAEEEIEALLDAAAPGGGEIDRVGVAVDSYLEHVLERFGADLTGLRIAVDCANGAYSDIAPGAFAKLGAQV